MPIAEAICLAGVFILWIVGGLEVLETLTDTRGSLEGLTELIVEREERKADLPI